MPKGLLLVMMEPPASLAALETQAYLAVSGANSTPWSRRILPRTIGRQRVVAERIDPGEEAALSPTTIARLGLARLASSPGEEWLATARATAGLAQLRLFRDESSIWVLAGFDRAVAPDAAAALFAGTGPLLLNHYAPYRRQ